MPAIRRWFKKPLRELPGQVVTEISLITPAVIVAQSNDAKMFSNQC